MYSLILHNKHKPHLTDMEVNQTNTNQTVRNRHCDLTFFFFFKNTLLNVNKALMWLHKAERESKDCVCAKKKKKKKKVQDPMWNLLRDQSASFVASPHSVPWLPWLCHRRLKIQGEHRAVLGSRCCFFSVSINSLGANAELSCFGPEVDWLWGCAELVALPQTWRSGSCGQLL